MYLSQGCTKDHWVEVEAPKGSIVRVRAGGSTWTMLATTDPGFAVSQPSSVHIGLGSTARIDSIEVDIPYQGTATLKGPIQANRRLVIHGL